MRAFLRDTLVTIIIGVVVYFGLQATVQKYIIWESSMEPSFYNGEYVLTNKVLYKLRDPHRGEVVIFKSPRNKEIDFIKRIIAVPGETVRIASGLVYVNGQLLPEVYLPSGTYTFGESFLKENQQFTVPQGQYFVLGDNRPHSSDSRDFGPIAKEDFIGRAIVRYFPFNKTGVIPLPNYGM